MPDLKWLTDQCESALSINHLDQLLDKLPNFGPLYSGLICYSLSGNPNLTWEIIIKYPPESWDWAVLSEHINITWEIITSNPGYPWNPNCVIVNPNITWEIIQANPEFGWDYGRFVANPNITWEILNSEDYYYWHSLLHYNNKTITWEMVLYITGGDYYILNDWIPGLSKHPNITWDTMQLYPEYEWDAFYVSANPNITWEIVANNPDYDWDYDQLSRNLGITLQDIKDNPMHDWSEKSIVFRNDITLDMLYSMEWVSKEYGIMVKNPNIRIDDMPEMCIDALANPNITYKEVLDYCNNDKQDMRYICDTLAYNEFNKHPIVIKNIKAKYKLKTFIYIALCDTMIEGICRIIAEYI